MIDPPSLSKLDQTSNRCKIVVGVNSLVSTTQSAYSNHMQFFFRLGRNYPEIKFIFVNPNRLGIDRMRNLCAKVALEYNADYILFLDDDVLIPFDSLQYLLETNADITAGDVLIRGFPFNHMAFNYPHIRDKYDLEGKNLKAIEQWSPGELGRAVDVDAVGFSLCLLKVSLLKKIPEPWFLTGPRNTEDIYYCMKARMYDPQCTIKVDTRIECAHILWSENITTSNRSNYCEYMEKQFGIKKESPIDEKSTESEQPKIKEKTPAGKIEYHDAVVRDQAQIQFEHRFEGV